MTAMTGANVPLLKPNKLRKEEYRCKSFLSNGCVASMVQLSHLHLAHDLLDREHTQAFPGGDVDIDPVVDVRQPLGYSYLDFQRT